jgi:hypothetical protein
MSELNKTRRQTIREPGRGKRYEDEGLPAGRQTGTEPTSSWKESAARREREERG